MAVTKYSILVLAAAAIAGGCASSTPPKSADAGAQGLDASAAPMAAVAPSANYVPPDPQPVMADPIPPAAATPVEDAGARPVIASAQIGDGGTYIVRKGDTLYRIAKAHYGNGKQWQKIALANPGLSPQTLRVGQRLMIPQ